MIKAKINGKKVEIETSWDEMPWGKFLELVEAKDDYQQVLAILLQQPVEDIRKAKFEGLDKVITALKFLQEPAKIYDKPVKLGSFVFPQDISMESIEKFECLRKYIKETQGKSVREQTKALGMYAAIYCLEGEFDEEKAKYLSEEYLSYPCLEVMSAGSFFMAKALSMQSGFPMNSLRRNILMKKSRPGFVTLMKRLGSMLRLT